ncbi:hypothetical protein KO533_04665 [Shewanella sp. NKUCC05_KAH]|uniref:hypothetical protein n=1 Tax=Shewanella sp. NKUCC05_KAH TaxID=2842126 RepID=UPI001C5A77CD|nr:hypothetical protein [Shewanella sp. NKUCC05_KAH]MBW3525864.1 hypothetical protein [Shewanella sp. NKUCC05_KAH]
MTSKVNVNGIISGHIETLRDATTKRFLIQDFVTFYLVPAILAITFIFFGVNISKEVASLLVNFGAIFTALLLSVLVLVYDQSSKLKSVQSQSESEPIQSVKPILLEQLYYNICYSIVLSIILIVVSLMHSIMFEVSSTLLVPFTEINITLEYGKFIFTPVLVFLTVNIVLTIIMVVKRMNALLTAK